MIVRLHVHRKKARVAMTENEAIKELETSIDLAKMCTQNYERKNEIQGYEMAIKALEEVQQYRQIGSVELFAETKKLSDLTKKCGTIGKVFDKCAEYAAIGTVEECRKSVEICKFLIGRNITPENMEEYMKFEDECISEGFTFNSLLEAREK